MPEAILQLFSNHSHMAATFLTFTSPRPPTKFTESRWTPSKFQSLETRIFSLPEGHGDTFVKTSLCDLVAIAVFWLVHFQERRWQFSRTSRPRTLMPTQMNFGFCCRIGFAMEAIREVYGWHLI